METQGSYDGDQGSCNGILRKLLQHPEGDVTISMEEREEKLSADYGKIGRIWNRKRLILEKYRKDLIVWLPVTECVRVAAVLLQLEMC